MNMKNSNIDFVVGPVENYEDQLYGHKAAYEAFVLLKDAEASKNLAKFISMLPALQTELPCDPKYKKEGSTGGFVHFLKKVPLVSTHSHGSPECRMSCGVQKTSTILLYHL